jgi:hypothetical protein
VYQLRIEKREGGEGVRVWVDSLAGLLGLVEMDVVEVHPWAAPSTISSTRTGWSSILIPVQVYRGTSSSRVHCACAACSKGRAYNPGRNSPAAKACI